MLDNGVPVTGYRLPDGTLVYSNTNQTFNPARGRLPGGAEIRSAPNTWHLMTVSSDGSDMRRFAWTPRTTMPWTRTAAMIPLTPPSQRWWSLAPRRWRNTRHSAMAPWSTRASTPLIRIARPGVEPMSHNITESIAGYRWGNTTRRCRPLRCTRLACPDGRILFSETINEASLPQSGNYAFNQNSKPFTLPLQGSQLRYVLRSIRPDSTQAASVALIGSIGTADAMDAKPIVVRPVGGGPGQWRAQTDRFTAPITDDPTLGNVPKDLPGYAWSQRTRSQIALTTIHNPNVYANPPLGLPYINNSPPLGSVAFAEIYVDANQFTGAKYNSTTPDDEVRAVKWTTVPVDARGAFTAQVPADTPAFIVLRDKDGNVVRGGNRSSLGIAQGNAPGRPGGRVQCVGCHLGPVGGSLDSVLPAGRTRLDQYRPSAVVTATSQVGEQRQPVLPWPCPHMTVRHNYVLAEGASTGGPYADTDKPWIASSNQLPQ